MARPEPLDLVRRRLAHSWPAERLEALPRAYFRVGDVLMLDLPLPEPEAEAAQAYADVLRKRSVLGREGGIEGELRQPRTRLLWGDPNTTTVHVENGVRYRLDPARVMWSAGNLAERQRVAAWRLGGETVVDLFAGVGYFALPVAVHARAARVIACEKNPIAHGFLRENAQLNKVAARFDARLGDCRDVAPRGVAHRVLMGLLPDAVDHVDVAVAALRPEGGWLHVHRVVGARDAAEAYFSPVAERVAEAGLHARLHHVQRVKSYGPYRVHVVLDVEVTR